MIIFLYYFLFIILYLILGLLFPGPLAAQVAQHGSTAAFNHKLRLQLLLEPLSYTVDVRRLLARSEGTAWRFDAVRQMLVPTPPPDAAASEAGAVPSAAGCEGGGAAQSEAAGEGAAKQADQRAVVVCGGAGEGKSTISAALVSGKGLEGLWPGGQGGGGGGGGVGVGAPALAAAPEAGSGEGGSGVLVAYHFLKYSDQRRLDPRRIVKSLAYQLALQVGGERRCCWCAMFVSRGPCPTPIPTGGLS